MQAKKQAKKLKSFSKELRVCIKAAKEAGKIVMGSYGKASFRLKKDHSFVSKADINSEKAIKNILKKSFPGYSFMGEESSTKWPGRKQSNNVFVVDPLDGTTNYKIANPFFNISIALFRNSQPYLGVVYNPYTKELFYAEKGKGAYLNRQRLAVSKTAKLKEAIIGYCHGSSSKDINAAIRIFAELKKKCSHLRQFGAAALELAYVAAGRIDAYYMPGVNLWDIAAGLILVEEAGGKITGFNNEEFSVKANSIIAANSTIHKKLLYYIKKAKAAAK